MASMKEDALIILRTLHERDTGVDEWIVCRDLVQLAGLTEQEFNKADIYLLKGGYLDGTMGGIDGHRSLTITGILYLEQELENRQPLSLDAERILRYIVQTKSSRPMFTREQIKEELVINDARYDDACDQLGNLDFIRDMVSQGKYEIIQAEQAGKMAVQNNFRLPYPQLVHTSYHANFDQRGQTVTYQYNAAGDINFGAVQNRLELVQELEKLRTELTKAGEAEVIDGEIISDARYQIEKAVNQAKKPDADRKTILDRLNEAKALLQGVGAAAGMVEAIIKASELAQKFF